MKNTGRTVHSRVCTETLLIEGVSGHKEFNVVIYFLFYDKFCHYNSLK